MTAIDHAQAVATRDILARPISSAGFAPFGCLIEPTADGGRAGLIDTALDLTQGRPRFYIMDLANRGQEFGRITGQ